MSKISLFEGDNRDSLRRLAEDGVKVHSVVTDPPYGLTSIKKRFGGEKAAAARRDGNDGSFSRLSGGFMGQTWDGTQIERDPEFWALLMEVMLPGAFCFAFAGSRTGHWQACAMEQAGFIIHPMHGWCYGTGFSKAHDAARNVRKKGGDGDSWEGWKHGTQAQKPALEPIFLAQKPMSEKTTGENLIRWGVGAVNVDDCRVPPVEGETVRAPQSDPHKRGRGAGEYGTSTSDTTRMHEAQRSSIEKLNTLGRYPSNLLTDGSDEVADLLPDGAMRYFHAFGPEDLSPLFYNNKAGKEDRAGSKHPTVKPIALLRHLIRHITPPGGTVLDPFAGSGTTAEAARLEGFSCVLMEQHDEYASFLRSRFFTHEVKNESCTNDPNRLEDKTMGYDEGFIDLLGEEKDALASLLG